MGDKPYILLFGESILMDGIAESLIKQELTNVIHICSSAPEAMDFINSLDPDLIVYELNAINTDPIFKIIREQTESLHLAIDLSCSQAILLNCQRKPTESMQALCDLVNQEANHKNLKREVY